MSIYYERPPAPPRSQIIANLFLLLLFGAAVGLLVWWRWPQPAGSGLNPNAEPRPVAARGDLMELEKTNISIYETAAPCVVHVTNLAQERGPFNLNVEQVPQGTGSGFIWDTDGHIVTNYHVVKGAEAAQVILNDRSTYTAQQVWAYPDKDVAVIWIKAPPGKLHPILVGTSHNLKVGQVTYAIGNPFGLDQTMTNGIVSALGREIEAANGQPIQGVIQTSSAINPGNSGGPLLDSAGRLIGMNTAILSPSGAFAGIGFALPVDEINQIVPQLLRHGKVVRPTLGVQIAEDQVARQLGVTEGALIVKVEPDSATAAAGLQGTRRGSSGQVHLGDIVVAVDGQSVNNGQDLRTLIQEHHSGDTVTLRIIRADEREDVKVTLK